MDTKTLTAAKYGLTVDMDEYALELAYAIAWEQDHAIGYPPVNHHATPLTAVQVRRQAYVQSEGHSR